MLKYVDTLITFSEIPSEITLCINISGCPVKCKDCHSSYLTGDIGQVLNWQSLEKLIKENAGISCICFMGGDNNPYDVDCLAETVKYKYPNLKTAWYSGRQVLSKDIHLFNFDYIKLGPYDKERGPLNNPNTNQKFYRVVRMTSGKRKLIDITYKFWRDADKQSD